jgi:hypothetical protein
VAVFVVIKPFNNQLGFEQDIWQPQTGCLAGLPQTSICGTVSPSKTAFHWKRREGPY